MYGSTQIETAWTIIPILIVVALYPATARVIHALQDAPELINALDVVAHQYWWELRYPKLGIVPELADKTDLAESFQPNVSCLLL